jgi:hypothetical protein
MQGSGIAHFSALENCLKKHLTLFLACGDAHAAGASPSWDSKTEPVRKTTQFLADPD